MFRQSANILEPLLNYLENIVISWRLFASRRAVIEFDYFDCCFQINEQCPQMLNKVNLADAWKIGLDIKFYAELYFQVWFFGACLMLVDQIFWSLMRKVGNLWVKSWLIRQILPGTSSCPLPLTVSIHPVSVPSGRSSRGVNERLYSFVRAARAHACLDNFLDAPEPSKTWPSTWSIKIKSSFRRN